MSAYRMNWLPEKKKSTLEEPQEKDDIWFAAWYVTAAHLVVYSSLIALAATAFGGACWALVWGLVNWCWTTVSAVVGLIFVVSLVIVADYDHGDSQNDRFRAKERARLDFEKRTKEYEASLRGQ